MSAGNRGRVVVLHAECEEIFCYLVGSRLLSGVGIKQPLPTHYLRKFTCFA